MPGECGKPNKLVQGVTPAFALDTNMNGGGSYGKTNVKW